MLVHRIRPIRSTLIARHSTLRGWLSDQPRNDASQIHLRREQREIAWMQLQPAMKKRLLAGHDPSRGIFSSRQDYSRLFFFWIAFLG